MSAEGKGAAGESADTGSNVTKKAEKTEDRYNYTYIQTPEKAAAGFRRPLRMFSSEFILFPRR